MPKDETQLTIDDPDVPFDGNPSDPAYLAWLSGASGTVAVDPDALRATLENERT